MNLILHPNQELTILDGQYAVGVGPVIQANPALHSIAAYYIFSPGEAPSGGVIVLEASHSETFEGDWQTVSIVYDQSGGNHGKVQAEILNGVFKFYRVRINAPLSAPASVILAGK